MNNFLEEIAYWSAVLKVAKSIHSFMRECGWPDYTMEQATKSAREAIADWH